MDNNQNRPDNNTGNVNYYYPYYPPAQPQNITVKQKGKAGRYIAIILILTVVIGVGAYFLLRPSKTDEELIKDRIDSFLKAYNSGDMEKVIDCLDSKSKNQYKAMMNIGNMLIGKTGYGVSLSDMFGLSVGTMSDDDILKIKNLTITIDSETTATAEGVMSYNDKMASKTDKVTFKMVKEDGDWFIKDMK